ncbi:interleukin-1 receptor-like 1 [Ctenodactylus gundi]
MYSTISGSRKSSRISCPTIQFYNWTEPLEWFKNCKALQGPKYRIHKSSLFIDNAGQEDEGDYTCKFIHTEQGANYSVTATRSFVLKAGRPSVYYTGAGCSALLILTVVAVVILKVFWIEVALFWRDVVRSYKAKNDGKLYDAYVIYPRNFIGGPEGPSAVEHFVHQVLPAVLENKCGYNLCIYGRDLLPGEDMATAVETCIRKSRRHLFVLTPQGSSSTEFTYEQEVALHCTLIQNDSKVVLVEIQDPGQPELRQAGVLPSSLHHLVCTQGTIKWTEDHAANKLSLNSRFWKRVRYQMPVPSRPSRKVSGETLPSSPGHSKVPRAKLST